MYFNNKNSHFHGIMFHHFHDDKVHKKGQGSISQDEFYKLLKFIGRKNILDADTFFNKLINKKLEKNEVCLTFDDAIKCQIDVALPVLEDLKIKSFFFVYTSIFEGKPDYLEIFRYFRMNCFNSINEFYSIFFKILDYDLEGYFKDKEELIHTKKSRYNFYSIEDIKFRIVRDYMLSKEDYESHMFSLMRLKNFNPDKVISDLFFEANDLVELDNLGHKIGLHTHTHPTKVESLSQKEQAEEYSKNQNVIQKILGKSGSYVNSSSHPLGSYNDDTLEILDNLGVKLAFKDNMKIEREKGMSKINNSFLEIAREDHTQIFKRMS